MTCYGQYSGWTANGPWTQESYESASRDASRRVRQLKKAGFAAKSFPLGPQVTSVGIVRMTMVDVRGASKSDLPTEGWNLERL